MAFIEIIKKCLKKNKLIHFILRRIKLFFISFYDIYFKVWLFYLCRFLKKIYLQKTDGYVSTLKNRYKGKPIFVIATGPSLDVGILDWLDSINAITISVNGVFKVYGKTAWRPTYYVMDDIYVMKSYFSKYNGFFIKNILNGISKEGCVFSDELKRLFKNRKDDLSINIGYVPVCYYDHWYTHYSKRYRYSKNLLTGCFDFYTVTNFAITLADYMGAKEIFMLGVDCDYTSSNVLHIGENNSSLTSEQISAHKKTEDGMLEGYRQLRRLISNDVKIYNVNEGGKVDAFERLAVEQLKERYSNRLIN